MPGAIEIFLDIETNWNRELTVVGFRSSETGLVQLVGEEITKTRLLRELPSRGTLVTYNGHCFDLTCIYRQLGIDLREHFESMDLRWVCQRHKLTGGQKLIEERIGFRRETVGIDGMEAIRLWRRYRHGDRQALKTLLRYNAEDLDGMVAIKEHLHHRNLLPRT